MTAATANNCRIVLGNPENGIISASGFHADFPASMWNKFESREEVPGRHGAVNKENLRYIPQMKCIILRPDISLKQEMSAGDYTTDGGTWGLSSVYGNPALKMAHQKDVTAKGWKITSTSDFEINQGFVLWWKKYATPEGGDPKIVITFGDLGGNESRIKLTVNPTQKSEIEYFPEKGGIEKTEFQLPKHYFATEFPLNILVLMILDNKIILADSGLEWMFAWEVKNYSEIVDIGSGGGWYPHITSNVSDLSVEGDGSIICGFKPLTYAESGGLSTALYYPGYIMAEPPVTDKKTVEPRGTSIDINGFMGGSDIGDENITSTNPEGFGIYFNVLFTGDGNSTPIYYRAAVRHEPQRISMSGPAQELNTQIVSFSQNMGIGKDGVWNGADITATVSCEEQFYPNIFMAKAPRVQYYLKLIGQENEILRDTHFVDVKEVMRPEHGQFLMDLASRDITKELELSPMLESVDYDPLIREHSWKHAHLMQDLATRGGATLIVDPADYADDPLLPYVTDEDNAVWQFKRNESIWQCMLKVRQYSGWMLYPDNEGRLVYKPRPTAATPENYVWSVNAMAIEDVRYKLIDLYRSRILVWGQASEDNPGDYPYRKGDNILGAGYHRALEEQMGRSRCLIVLDPGLNDWDSIKRMVDGLYDYYTRDPFFFSGRLNFPEAYPTIWPGQVVKLSDSKMQWNGEPIIDKKFVITGISLQYTGGDGMGTVVMEVL